MKLIIDIPEETYEIIENINYFYNMSRITERIEKQEIVLAIKNGTPLPKGHGDLIDRKALINNGIQKGFCDWYDEIKYAPAIIEADTPKREEGIPLEENDSGYNCENWIP